MRGIGIGVVFGVLLLLAEVGARAEEGAAPPRVTVRRAQELLSSMGYRPGKVDGIKGPRTERALKSFQLAEELLASGRLDRATRQVMAEMLTISRSADKARVAEALEATDELLGRADQEGDDRPVEALVAATEIGAPRDRVDAVEVLARLHSPRARATLGIVLYRNDLPAARIKAAQALGELADPVSLYALALAEERETDPGVRKAIQEGLEHGLPKELPPRGPILPPDPSAPGSVASR